MEIYCADCSAHTEHKYIGTNPDTEQPLYQCSECEERQNVEEDDWAAYTQDQGLN